MGFFRNILGLLAASLGGMEAANATKQYCSVIVQEKAPATAKPFDFVEIHTRAIEKSLKADEKTRTSLERFYVDGEHAVGLFQWKAKPENLAGFKCSPDPREAGFDTLQFGISNLIEQPLPPWVPQSECYDQEVMRPLMQAIGSTMGQEQVGLLQSLDETLGEFERDLETKSHSDWERYKRGELSPHELEEFAEDMSKGLLKRIGKTYGNYFVQETLTPMLSPIEDFFRAIPGLNLAFDEPESFSQENSRRTQESTSRLDGGFKITGAKIRTDEQYIPVWIGFSFSDKDSGQSLRVGAASKLGYFHDDDEWAQTKIGAEWKPLPGLSIAGVIFDSEDENSGPSCVLTYKRSW